MIAGRSDPKGFGLTIKLTCPIHKVATREEKSAPARWVRCSAV